MTILSIAAICFFIRAVPRIVIPHAYNADTFFHLYCAQLYRENGFRIPDRFSRVVVNHRNTYPPLYHFFLALFPERIRLWVERFTGAVFDTANLLLIYSYSLWLGGRLDFLQSESSAIWVALLYALSPGLLRNTTGPRAFNGCPRVISQFFYLAHLLSLHYALVTTNYTFFFVGVVCGAFVVLTAKFGTQVLLFFGIGFSIFVSPWYVVVLVLCILTSILISKGHAWRIIEGHVWHSFYFARHLQQAYLYPRMKRLIPYLLHGLRRLRWAIVHKQWKDSFLWSFTERHALHMLLTAYAHVIVALGATYLHWGDGELPTALLVWFGAGFICFLVTHTRWFMFLGEAERYLEFAIFPSYFLTVYALIPSHEHVLQLLLVYSLVMSIGNVFAFLLLMTPIHMQYLDSKPLIDELNQLPTKNIFPIGNYHWQILHRTKHNLVRFVSGVDERILETDEPKLFLANQPAPSDKYEEIVSRYQVNAVLTNKDFLEYYTNDILKDPQRFYGTVESSIEFENCSMVAYLLNRRDDETLGDSKIKEF